MSGILKLKGLLLLTASLLSTERFVFQSGSQLTANAAQTTSGVALLDLAFSHENKTEFNPGDSFWYSFKLLHDTASNGNAKDINVTWYVPYYIQPGNLLSANIDPEVDRSEGRITFKIRTLSKGLVGQFKFQVKLDANFQLDKGHHYIVSTIQSTWKSESSDIVKDQMESYSIEITMPGCSKALGISEGSIRAHQLFASSSIPVSRPEMARYNKDAWCAQKVDNSQFVQVLFAKKTRVTRIVTWGRNRKQHWVTKYTVQFSDDNQKWISYKENGIEKVFNANNDPDTAVGHWLLYPLPANYIRINPKGWNIQICLRFELYGCEVSHDDNCVDPIGMANGSIPDASLSDSVGRPEIVNPVNGRLDKAVTDFPFGWSGNPDAPNAQDWLQIDLGSVHKVTRTAMQGSYNEPYPIFYVTSYKIRYSNNSIDWYTAKENGNDKAVAMLKEKIEIIARLRATMKGNCPSRMVRKYYNSPETDDSWKMTVDCITKRLELSY